MFATTAEFLPQHRAQRQQLIQIISAAVHQWAFCSLSRSGWAREFFDSKIAAGKAHHAALRALSNRWLEILWHCLVKGMLYDENLHQAPPRSLGRSVSTSW